LATPLELVLGARRFLRPDESGDTSSSLEIPRLSGCKASTGIALGMVAFRGATEILSSNWRQTYGRQAMSNYYCTTSIAVRLSISL
jgi:hypothetical protein